MTHNIVAQFSCSLDSNGNLKEYRVVSGSIFNEEYNETLDSATLLLSQIHKEDRLSNIKPYDYVRVYDKSTWNNSTHSYGFDKLYLVDNFDEKENNIKEHLFGYTINLMSETKLLEKIQCPNLTITHDINNGVSTKKTIFEHMKRYMELFVPKIKFSVDGVNWSYRPLIDYPAKTHGEPNYGSIRIRIDNGDFQSVGPLYTVTKDSAALDSSIDYETVELDSYELNPELRFTIENVTFDSSTGKFTFSGTAPEPGFTFVEISYQYYVFEETEFYKRFNVPCADLSFAAPTLRQLLTTLMQQVGCIPIVRNRKLSFLDFQKDAVPFDEDGDYSLDNTVNYIKRSLSSDSYVNTLVNLSENVLDSENEVICETLGFRDRNNVLLKQEENLCLETSLPIYKVNQCILHAPGTLGGYLGSSYHCVLINNNPSQEWPCIYYKEVNVGGGNASIKFCINPAPDTVDVTVIVDKIYFLSRDSVTDVYAIVDDTQSIGSFVLNYSTTESDSISYKNSQQVQQTMAVRSKTFTFSGLPNNAVALMLSGRFIKNQDNTERLFTFIRFDNADSHVTYHGIDTRNANEWFANTNWSDESHYMDCFIARYNLTSIAAFQTWDISKLVVENSIRQLLERDFQKMRLQMPESDPTTWTLDNLSKYVYGTVGYSIGSKTISGFSDEFYVGESTTFGWITKGYTYIENIVRALELGGNAPRSNALTSYFDGFADMNIGYTKNSTDGVINDYENYNLVNYAFYYFNAGTGHFDTTGATFFTTFFVDLYYQPLNSFNISYVKADEDVPITLAQYDGNASGLTDFDRLSIHEQEQVNRVGNETLFISQRTNDFSKVKGFENGPLVFEDDVNRNGSIENGESVKYIIFRRSFTINNNYFNVSYTGSKDAVLKNYFTSIRTKYRAYQYVDYTQSVLRKEKDVFYVRVASNYYNGDDRIYGGNDISNDVSFTKNLIYDFEYNSLSESDVPTKISYEIEKDIGKVANGIGGYNAEEQIVKNSVSCYSTSNMLGITYEYMDNNGAGPYIKDITKDEDLGGVPQSWQIWGDDYNLKHQVAFTNYIDFYSQLTSSSTTDAAVATQIRNIARSPIVDSSYPYDIVFYVCEDNTQPQSNLKRLFYKDYAERINHTVQFIYYAPNKDVLFSEDLISGVPMLQRYNNPFNLTLASNSNTFELNTNPHRTDGESPVANDYIEFISGESDDKPARIRVHFHGYKIIKMAHYDSETTLTVDIAAFKCPTSLINNNNAVVDYYFMVNDTKTDNVYYSVNGVLVLKYEVDTYNSESGQDMARTCHLRED